MLYIGNFVSDAVYILDKIVPALELLYGYVMELKWRLETLRLHLMQNLIQKSKKKTQSTPGSESDWDKTHTHRNIQIHFGLRCTMEITAITHVSVIC